VGQKGFAFSEHLLRDVGLSAPPLVLGEVRGPRIRADRRSPKKPEGPNARFIRNSLQDKDNIGAGA
jgi:hypothetical protein